jgi:DNA-binding transcriptional LysR family regulator
VTGELIVTALPVLSSRIAPVLADFVASHPGTLLRFLTDERVFRLEYGEAHVAIRAGRRPDQPDNIVQPFYNEQLALYATRGYVDRHGPLVEGTWEGHRFVGPDDREHRAPFFAWMTRTIPDHLVTFRTSHQRTAEDAVHAGAGIGFMSVGSCRALPDLVQMLPPRDDWASPLWLVTHVDLHRTAKVQTLVNFLKSRAKELEAA